MYQQIQEQVSNFEIDCGDAKLFVEQNITPVNCEVQLTGTAAKKLILELHTSCQPDNQTTVKILALIYLGLNFTEIAEVLEMDYSRIRVIWSRFLDYVHHRYVRGSHDA